MTAQTSHFRKTIPAYLAALGMTGLIAACILAVGLGALFNRNTVPVQAAASSDATAALQSAALVKSTQPLSAGEILQQLQEQVAQYQAREAQYQTQLQQAADQINQLSQQNQQYQSLVQSLQDAGLIQVSPDGRVSVGRGFRGDDDDD